MRDTRKNAKTIGSLTPDDLTATGRYHSGDCSRPRQGSSAAWELTATQRCHAGDCSRRRQASSAGEPTAAELCHTVDCRGPRQGPSSAGDSTTARRATSPAVQAGEDIKEAPRVIRMVACDLDGTLLEPGESGVEPIREIMALLRSRNVRFTLATGRVFGSVKPLLDELDLQDPVVTNGGAMVAAKGETPLLEKKIQRAVAARIANELRPQDIPFYYIVGKDMLTEWEGPETESYSQGIGYPIKVVSAGYLDTLEPTQIVVRVNPEEAVRFVRLYEKRPNQSIQCLRSLPHLVEFQAKGVSKACGLAFLSSHFGIRREEVLAIGDGLNDLDMLKWAGVSGCVANAHPEACHAAFYVSNRPYAEGVLEIIEKFTMPIQCQTKESEVLPCQKNR